MACQFNSTGQFHLVAVPEEVFQLHIPDLAVESPARLRPDETQARRFDVQAASYQAVAPKAFRYVEFQLQPIEFAAAEGYGRC